MCHCGNSLDRVRNKSSKGLKFLIFPFVADSAINKFTCLKPTLEKLETEPLIVLEINAPVIVVTLSGGPVLI